VTLDRPKTTTTAAGARAVRDDPATDLACLAECFATVPEFADSALYQTMSVAVSESKAMLRLASHRRRGQHPAFLFFAAIHYLLLKGAEHELRSFYPSIVGEAARSPQDGVREALTSFCATYASPLRALLETRLVQSNSVRRSLVLWLALHALAYRVRAPLHIVEVGASAGINLCFDRYSYRAAGGRRFGALQSPVQIVAECYGRVPDLDVLPEIGSATGIDLNPLRASDPEDRAWLEALLWADNADEARLLKAAVPVVAADPPIIFAGDAIDLCPVLSRELPRGEPRLAIELATKMHVPEQQWNAFDDAIESLGEGGPLYRLAFAPTLSSHAGSLSAPYGVVNVTCPDGASLDVAVVGPRIEWFRPLG
jgi:hypothetical protein